MQQNQEANKKDQESETYYWWLILSCIATIMAYVYFVIKADNKTSYSDMCPHVLEYPYMLPIILAYIVVCGIIFFTKKVCLAQYKNLVQDKRCCGFLIFVIITAGAFVASAYIVGLSSLRLNPITQNAKNYQICKAFVRIGEMPIPEQESELIETKLNKKVERFLNYMANQINRKNFYFLQGHSGIGKSTAIQRALNRIQQDRNALIYYIDFQCWKKKNVDLNKIYSKGSENKNSTEVLLDITPITGTFINILSSASEQDISDFIKKISQKRPVFFVLDGVNSVKNSEEHIQLFGWFATLKRKYSNFFLTFISSEEGTGHYLNLQSSQLRDKHGSYRKLSKNTKKQIKNFVKLSINKIFQIQQSDDQKRIRKVLQKDQSRDLIASLSYSFREADRIVDQLKIIMEQQRVFQIQQAVQILLKNEKSEVIKFIKPYQKTICKILAKKVDEDDDLEGEEQLLQRNILYSSKVFYRKIYKVALKKYYYNKKCPKYKI